MERQLLAKRVRYILIMFLLAQSQAISAANLDTQALVESIANTLQYPASRISVTDMSDSPKAKARGGVLGLLLESKDGTFATLTIGIAKQGSILTPQLESECEDAVKAGKSLENRVSKVDFGGGAYGYSGIGILGPGGSGERIIATWPERGIDLQLSISVPGEGLATDASAEAYQRLINDGGNGLVQKLFDSMNHVFEYVRKSNLRLDAGQSIKARESSKPSLLVPHERNESDTGKTSSSAPKPTPSEEPTSLTTWSLIFALIVAVIGLLWLVLKKGKCEKTGA